MRTEADDTNGSRLRVGLDITSLLDQVTGVGAFTEAVAGGMAARDDVDLHVFAVSWRGRDRLVDVAPASATLRTTPIPARLARAAWQRTSFPSARLVAGAVDVVHGPNFVAPPGGRAAEVVTVHDLTALHYPEMCTPDVLQWPDLLRRSLRRGAWVHTVSEFVAAEVREAFPEAGDRVVAVPNGFTAPIALGDSTSAALGRSIAGPDRYVLALGTIEPRKDLPTLVEAFGMLAADDADLRLVLAGGDGLAAEALTEAVQRSPAADRIVRTGRVDDAQRAALLRGAAVVAYPSRYEGFGLVPLEAMSVGVPVVATAVGAIPEVTGDAALLVPASDAAGLARGLADALADGPTRTALVERGRERAANFSWDATVEGLVGLYRRAAGRV